MLAELVPQRRDPIGNVHWNPEEKPKGISTKKATIRLCLPETRNQLGRVSPAACEERRFLECRLEVGRSSEMARGRILIGLFCIFRVPLENSQRPAEAPTSRRNRKTRCSQVRTEEAGLKAFLSSGSVLQPRRCITVAALAWPSVDRKCLRPQPPPLASSA